MRISREDERDIITDPVEVVDNTVVADKSAKISSLVVAGSLSLQGMLLPIIVFVLIMMTSQGLMNAISTEKIDKTLETLLSTPVSRTSILGAKMLCSCNKLQCFRLCSVYDKLLNICRRNGR